MKTYKFHQDMGHGWLAVPVDTINGLGIRQKITRYSYVNEGTAYLEEDCDMQCFMDAYEQAYDVLPEIDCIIYNGEAPCRNYSRLNQ